MTMHLALTEWDPPTSFRYTVSQGDGHGNDDNRRSFQAVAGGTRLTGTTEGFPRSWQGLRCSVEARIIVPALGSIDPGACSASLGSLFFMGSHSPPWWFALLARRALRPVLGRGGAAEVVRIADERYEPPPSLARTPAGRSDIQLASYLLALRDALVETGRRPAEAVDLLAEVTSRVMGRLQRPLDALAATVHPQDPFARTRFRENLARRLFYRPPDWVMTDVDMPGCYAFDVHHCLYADYLTGLGEGQFCQQVLCDQDRRMAERHGQPLLRSGTLAAGADHCDFRYIIRTGSNQ